MPDRTEETTAATRTSMVGVQFTPRELALVCEALDSHVYWQLSDEHYRRDGYVHEPGSDDAHNAEEISEAETLLRRLGPALLKTTSTESS